MAKFSFNVADVEEGALIPEGHYPVIVNSVTAKQAEDKDYPYLEWELEITEGEFQGRKRTMRTSLSPKALWRLVPVLRAVGALDDETELVDLDIDDETGELLEPNVIGQVGLMAIIHEMYNSRKVARVDDLLPIDALDEEEEAPAPAKPQLKLPAAPATSSERKTPPARTDAKQGFQPQRVKLK